MRDKRLIYPSERAYFQRYEEVKRHVRLSTGMEVFAKAIKSWWNTKHKSDADQIIKLYAQVDLQSELDDILRTCTLPKSSQRYFAARVIGACVAELVPSYEILKNSVTVLSHGEYYGWQGFIEGFTDAIGTDTDCRERWSKFLVTPLDLSMYLESLPSEEGSPTLLVEEEAVMKKLGRTAYLWGNYGGSLNVSSLSVLIYSLMVNIVESKVPAALESIPSHLIRRSLVQRLRISEDPQMILNWLRNCPPVFYDDQKWTGSTVAIICLEESLIYLRRVSELDSDETARFITAICEILLNRIDGNYLSIEFGVELIRRLTPNATDQRMRNICEQILDVIVSGLITKNATVSTLHAFWSQSVEVALPYVDEISRWSKQTVSLSALPYIVLASRMFTSEAAKIDDHQDSLLAVWNWYFDALHAQDPALEGHVSPFGNSGQWIFQTIGGVLCGLNQPNKIFEKAWGQLFSQRQRSRFIPAGSKFLTPSIHLLRVGLFSLLWPSTDEMKAIEFWGSLLKKSANLILGHDKGPFIRKAELCLLFPFINHIFKGDLPRALEMAKPILSGDDWMILLCAANLLDNGFSLEAIMREMSHIGFDLMASKAVFDEWKNLIGFGKQEEGMSVEQILDKLTVASAV